MKLSTKIVIAAGFAALAACGNNNSASNADMNAGADLNAGSADLNGATDMNATGNSELNAAGTDTGSTNVTANSAATNAM